MFFRRVPYKKLIHRRYLSSIHRYGPKPGEKVVVAMSGGVDSSVTAYLLKKQGFDVDAVYMRNWDTSDEQGVCTSEEDWKDVQRVCEQLKIPCRRLDFTKEYWTEVFERVLSDYAKGVTPNPDILCNREIKFGTLMERALEGVGEWLATGHYARVVRAGDQIRLFRGIDRNKDQSYYLANVGESKLRQAMFPLGELTKPQVREIANEANLATKDKAESMGICFVGKRKRFSDFLAEYIPQNPGVIVNAEGKPLGKHQGLFSLTIGQCAKLSGQSERWFVIDKDIEKNRIIVGPGSDHPKLFSDSLIARDFFWINGEPKEISRDGFDSEAQIRYRIDPERCKIVRANDSQYHFSFHNDQRGVVPGQYVVVYQGDWCLGGGVIDQVFKSDPSSDS
ncbi:hypothetical protein K7432_002205 [Basidiobolus ranarum]|uniref:tRNA-5-taurinomethyluridine 2-sulfurtransferase n=1 Tax=Basidiobolus ranarum TaxID=34480 RepID=A0ABR2W859_9FUNG